MNNSEVNDFLYFKHTFTLNDIKNVSYHNLVMVVHIVIFHLVPIGNLVESSNLKIQLYFSFSVL